MTIAAAREQAPGLRSGFRRKRREGMSVGECKPDVPARALLDRRDDERVARIDPGPRGFVAAEELRELAILQAEPVVVGPVRRALPWSGIYHRSPLPVTVPLGLSSRQGHWTCSV